MAYDALIFDINGTLRNASATSAKGWNAGLEKLGIDKRVSAEQLVRNLPEKMETKTSMHEIKLKPIGFVSSPVTERVDENWGEIVSKITLNSEYAGALTGLEEFSHAIILTYLHQARFEKEKHLQRRPRNLKTMPKVGILSQRAKNRPNPIGVTAVKILKVSDNCLEVKGLDAISGTPVLDIKPYYPDYDKVDKPKVPEWVDRLMKDYF